MSTPHGARFEVRAARTGYLQTATDDAHAAIDRANAIATAAGMACFVIDLALPVVANDPRIVWADTAPHPAALEWVAAHCTYEL